MRISHVEFHLTTYAGVNQDEDPLKANDTKITLVNDLCGNINLIEWIHKNNSENGINDKWATKTAEKSQPKYVEKKKTQQRSGGWWICECWGPEKCDAYSKCPSWSLTIHCLLTFCRLKSILSENGCECSDVVVVVAFYMLILAMYGLVDSKWYLYVLLGVENFITFVSLRTVNQLWEKCNVNGTKGTPHAHWGHFNNNRERERRRKKTKRKWKIKRTPTITTK